MLLSVVSALARLEIDPWQEAARLPDLPEDRAVAALDHLIRLIPAPGWDRATSPPPHRAPAASRCPRPARRSPIRKRKEGGSPSRRLAARGGASRRRALQRLGERRGAVGRSWRPIDLTSRVASSAQPWVEAGYLFLPDATAVGLAT